jgi:voltage-gated potassium channel Kch
VILGSVMRRNNEAPPDAGRQNPDVPGSGGPGGRGSDPSGDGTGRSGSSGGNGGNGGPRTVIVGCGRVGAELAGRLSSAGHEVIVLDLSTDAFNRLPEDFAGQAIRGDATDEDVLRRAGVEGADQLFALTEGDNRNVLVAQMASETLGVRNVVAKVNDPVRADAYAALGIATICRTTMLVEALATHIGVPGLDVPLGVVRATGHHPGGEHDDHDVTGSAVPSAPLG